MAIVFGKMLFGKCDQIEGEGFVATNFFFISYLPLVPLQTMFVAPREGQRPRGVPLPLSWKSVLLAYARTAAWFSLFMTGLFTIATLYELVGIAARSDIALSAVLLFGAVMGAGAMLSALGLWLSYRLVHAWPERRQALLALAGRC